ncbi:MAG TPA: D-tagatose-bisphosphate aldolase, class II, non-catalytic subunit [Steroidobacteraceae bacterium]|nr:D-tagatose-bisphosphate aldolase, class II, non-catalytic subunit [Steroidobacteraceae bacterium]
MKALQDIVARHTRGEVTGIWSLCSAHPAVIESAMHEAGEAGTALLVEATSNQVNQFGGYTGMRPPDFVRFLREIAVRAGFPAERLWIGGDHLGPNAWRGEPADIAMAKAAELVRGYVAAGFRKIHLDCSMACAGDAATLPEEVVAARASQLAAAAEKAWDEAGGEPPAYVIGTEVPTPGGATEDLATLAVTTPDAAAATVEAHRAAFSRAGLESAWPRVVALVVQPGVEFDHHKVIDYRPREAKALSEFIGRQSQFVFEAHSTDYQPATALRALVRDHFAILKVGPGATFALRETLWGLAAIEQELDSRAPDLRKAVVATMHADPQHWRGHYHGEGPALDLDLQYSLSDRIRYYWPYPEVQRAVDAMRQRLDRNAIPLTLLSQFLPRQHDAVRDGRIQNTTEGILREGVAAALRPYFDACAASPRAAA